MNKQLISALHYAQGDCKEVQIFHNHWGLSEYHKLCHKPTELPALEITTKENKLFKSVPN